MSSEAALIKDLDSCVRCGSCKALCPTFVQTGVETMSARGRLMLVRALAAGELAPSDRLYDALMSCLLCGMCDAACPAGVRAVEAIYRCRGMIARRGGKGAMLRLAAGFLFRRPLLSFTVARLAGPFIRPYIEGLPFKAVLPEKPFRKGHRILKPDTPRRAGRVAVFTGCAVNYMQPHLGAALLRVLLSCGFEVVFPAGEVCCGAPLRAVGLEGEARKLARRNLASFGRLKADVTLSLCPTCTLALKSQYAELMGEGIANAMDATEFLRGRLNVISELQGRALYHDPCHLRFGLGISREPRELLHALGADVVEPSGQGCCGFSIGLTHRELSLEILQKRKEAFGEVPLVATSCPGCVMQLSRIHPDVRHVIELVDACVALPQS